jgi:cytochrome d ubiquinol oxidase subunit II
VEDAFRTRALVMAPVAGAAALAGLIVLHHDARHIWDGLTSGGGLVAVIVSALAGISTFVLVLQRRYSLARLTAAAAVAAVIAGWGLAQRPDFLPGLTIEKAASGHASLVSLLVALGLGALALAPSLAFLFSLVLRGRFDVGTDVVPTASAARLPTRDAGGERPLLAALAIFGSAVVLMIGFDATWSRILGVAGLLAAIAVGFVALVTRLTALEADDPGL